MVILQVVIPQPEEEQHIPAARQLLLTPGEVLQVTQPA
jgi:hypothetical protein